MEDFESNVNVSDNFEDINMETTELDAAEAQNNGENPIVIGVVSALAGAAGYAIGKKVAPAVKNHFAATKESRLRKKAERLSKKQLEIEKELASFSKDEEAK